MHRVAANGCNHWDTSAFLPGLAGCVFNHRSDLDTEKHELCQVRRFAKIVGRTQAQHALPVRRNFRRADDQYLHVFAFWAHSHAFQNLFAADLRQVQIDQNYVWRQTIRLSVKPIEKFDGYRPIAHDVQTAIELRLFNCLLDEVYIRGIILHQEDIQFFILQ